MNAHLRIRRFANGIVAIALITTILGFAPTELLAQQFAIRAQGGPKWEAKLHEELMQQLSREKTDAESRIVSLLAEVDQVCDLSDVQSKKLMVASKGAIESYMASETKKIADATKDAGFDFDPDNPPKTKEAEDDKIKLNQARGFVMLDLTKKKKNSDVEHQRIWINALEKTLSDQQNKKLEASLEQRKNSLRKFAVNAFIAKVDLKLLLSLDQREQLTVFVDKHHGQQLAEELETPKIQNQGVMILGEGQATISPDANIHSEVAAILSQSQRNQWIRSFRPELDRLGRPN